METNQTKIRAASSTVIMMRKVDLDASSERTRKEDGRPKASRRGKDNSTEHATIAGRRVTEAETAGVKGATAKVNREGNVGYAKSEHGYKGGYHNNSGHN